MTHYLVVAHRTAPGVDLVDALGRLAATDASAAFTVLVTATHHPIEGQTPRAEADAKQRGQQARAQLQEANLYPVQVVVGDGSPQVAAEDELRAHPDVYDAIVLCTPPPSLLDRLSGDVRRHMEERLRLPVLHAHRGNHDNFWQRERGSPLGPIARLWERTRLTERPKPGEWRPPQSPVPSWRELIPVALLMVVYLAGGLTLALTVNRGFYLNDVVALIVYTAVIGGLLFALRRES